MNEAARLVLEGEPVEVLDGALLDFGFPVGPITLLDEVGIDVGPRFPILEKELGGEQFQAPRRLTSCWKTIAGGARTARASISMARRPAQQAHRQGGARRRWTRASRRARRQAPGQTGQAGDRRALRAADAQRGGHGAGWRRGGLGPGRRHRRHLRHRLPPFLGGPFRYMDSLGIDYLVGRLEHHQKRFGDRFAPVRG